MKKLFFMVIVLVIAGIVYAAGCEYINQTTAVKPDVVIRMVEQPSFENTVRNW